jgi:hypothetical protein
MKNQRPRARRHAHEVGSLEHEISEPDTARVFWRPFGSSTPHQGDPRRPEAFFDRGSWSTDGPGIDSMP